MKILRAAFVVVLLVSGVAHADRRRPVVFGIQTAQENTTFEELAATWKKAEELGFESAWLYDHFLPIIGKEDEPCLDGWTMLAALAPQTKKLRIGILVTGNTYRNPAQLAKVATTVDQVSGGRLDFGIGAGWFEKEHTAYGFPFYTAKERADRLGEALEVITRLWREDRVTFDGKFYDIADAAFVPKPVQKPHPPIVIGGKGEHWIMPRVARYADEWNAPVGVSPDGIRERMKIVDAECKKAGREPCVERISVLLPLVNMSGIPLAGPATRLGARLLVEKRIADSLLAGSSADIEKRIRGYVDAGVTRVILNVRPPFDHDLLARFASEVMPAFRK
jgi:F420-dependent oxidoreductase-like protein